MYPELAAAANLVPSEEEAALYQYAEPAEVTCCVQLAPPFELVYMYPPFSTAINFVPSEDEAIPYQDLAPDELPCVDHVAPLSVLVYI